MSKSDLIPGSSWDKAGKWYQNLVAQKGHYYHEHVVLPGVIRLLELKPGDKVLDLGCGNGVLAGKLPQGVKYVGIDAAGSLIKAAKEQYKDKIFWIADVTKTLPTNEVDFSQAAIILALQNIKEPEAAIRNAAKHLRNRGRLVIVLNHPCFRIPRQSSWETDEHNKLQYRRINRYMSPLEIPITIHPGESQSPVTWDYHYPLSAYSGFLSKNGFVVEAIEEWVSDKESEGKAAKAENRARAEFPLFLAISARKVTV